ncbi:MAG: ferredoxin--NADP reductase, partial [Pirellulaceae bacterium]
PQQESPAQPLVHNPPRTHDIVSPAKLPDLNVERLRTEFYNASVVSIERCHDELMIVRVRPDRGIPRFLAGQYTVLGLGYWEPRAADCQPEGDITQRLQRLIKRAYSISCPLLDEAGQLVGVNDLHFLEFYITLVRHAQHPPALTPRMFALEPGDRIFCGPHMHGHYTLTDVPRDANVIFAATGTGEAPHNAMTAQLLKTGHRGRVVQVTCVRVKQDLGYLATHRRLQEMSSNYRYVALTTREPENLDASRPDYVGKRYLQDYFASGDIESETGLPLDPDNTHVFLCGHPDMIGAPLRTHDPSRRYPRPQGMVETLEHLRFRVDLPHQRGNVHFEKYW